MIPTLSDAAESTPIGTADSARALVRHLRLPGTRNLRDVGGYPARDGRRTRWGVLYRTDALDLIPRATQDGLVERGLRCVVDLRWPDEIASWPSVFASDPRVRYEHIPLLADDPTPEHGLAYTYRHILDERSEHLARAVRAILSPGGLPAVVGCAAGKDRTGVTIALLLSAVGVPAEVIVADYALTFEAFADPHDPADPHLTDWRSTPLELECPPDYMERTLEHLEHRHGGAAALLRRHGIGEAEIERLVEALTEPA